MKIRADKNTHRGNWYILPSVNVISNVAYSPNDLQLHFNWLVFHCWIVFDGVGIEYLPFIVIPDQPLISVRKTGRLPVYRILFLYIRGNAAIIRLFNKGIRISF